MSTGVPEAGASGEFDVYRARLESDEVKSSRRARILAARTAELADAEADAEEMHTCDLVVEQSQMR